MSSREVVLGVDFGTSYSRAVAIIDGSVHHVLDAGDAVIPTVVHYPERAQPIVGREAVRYIPTHPTQTVVSIKRILGRPYTDPEVHTFDQGVGFQIKAGPGGVAILHINGGDYAPAQIAAVVLQRLKTLAERRFGGTIRRAVMTVPAEAPKSYLQALSNAASMAHLEVLQFLVEPIGGLLAYGLAVQPARRRIAVCDFGGGTFDVTLVEQSERKFYLAGVSGDMFLGGDDFDAALAEGVAGLLYSQKKVDIHRDAVAWANLHIRCESVKRQLSTDEKVRLHMNDRQSGGHFDVDLIVDRAWVEPRWKPLVSRSMEAISRAFASSSWNVQGIDELVLIGGTVLIPVVRRTFMELFGREARTSPHANLAVATGAAMLAAWRSGQGTAPVSLQLG